MTLMANPNTILAEKIIEKLKAANILDSGIDEAAFKTKLQTGKLVASDWNTSLVQQPITPSQETNYEATETGN